MVRAVEDLDLGRVGERLVENLAVFTNLVADRVDDPVTPTGAELHEADDTLVGAVAVVLEVDGNLLDAVLLEVVGHGTELFGRVDPDEGNVSCRGIGGLWVDGWRCDGVGLLKAKGGCLGMHDLVVVRVVSRVAFGAVHAAFDLGLGYAGARLVGVIRVRLVSEWHLSMRLSEFEWTAPRHTGAVVWLGGELSLGRTHGCVEDARR